MLCSVVGSEVSRPFTSTQTRTVAAPLFLRASRLLGIEVVGVRKPGARASLHLHHLMRGHWRGKWRRLPVDIGRQDAARIRLSRNIEFGYPAPTILTSVICGRGGGGGNSCGRVSFNTWYWSGSGITLPWMCDSVLTSP